MYTYATRQNFLKFTPKKLQGDYEDGESSEFYENYVFWGQRI